MSPKCSRLLTAAAGISCFATASTRSSAAVFLEFSTPLSRTVGPGGTTQFDVLVRSTDSVNDRISSIDFSIKAQRNGVDVSNLFQLTARSQDAAQSATFSVAPFSGKNFTPTYFGNLGGDSTTGIALVGGATYSEATYTLRAGSGSNGANTPANGTYTFSFAPTSANVLIYSGAPAPGTGVAPEFPFAGFNTLSITVPEPATLAVASLGLCGVVVRRRRSIAR